MAALLPSRLPCRDQANAVPAPCVHNDENSPERIGSNGDEPLLVRIVIQKRQRQVLEHGDGVGEIDAVLREVPLGLVRVPLELHGLSVCTFVHGVNRPRDAGCAEDGSRPANRYQLGHQRSGLYKRCAALDVYQKSMWRVHGWRLRGARPDSSGDASVEATSAGPWALVRVSPKGIPSEKRTG